MFIPTTSKTFQWKLKFPPPLQVDDHIWSLRRARFAKREFRDDFSSLSNLWVGFWNIPSDLAQPTPEQLKNYQHKIELKTWKYLSGKFSKVNFSFSSDRWPDERKRKNWIYFYRNVNLFLEFFPEIFSEYQDWTWTFNKQTNIQATWSPLTNHFCTLFSLLWTFIYFHPTFLKWKLSGGVNETMIFVRYFAYLDEWLEFSL